MRKKRRRVSEKIKFFSFSTLAREIPLVISIFFNAKIIELRMFISYISSLPTCLVFHIIFLILCKHDTFFEVSVYKETALVHCVAKQYRHFFIEK